MPTARTTSGARSAAPRCMAAMKGTVQSSPRSAISVPETAWPARTASVSVDHRRHRLRLCLSASRASSREPRARNRSASGVFAKSSPRFSRKPRATRAFRRRSVAPVSVPQAEATAAAGGPRPRGAERVQLERGEEHPALHERPQGSRDLVGHDAGRVARGQGRESLRSVGRDLGLHGLRRPARQAGDGTALGRSARARSPARPRAARPSTSSLRDTRRGSAPARTGRATRRSSPARRPRGPGPRPRAGGPRSPLPIRGRSRRARPRPFSGRRRRRGSGMAPSQPPVPAGRRRFGT